ncbi:cytochrome P450 [Phyllosticta citrichinensis]
MTAGGIRAELPLVDAIGKLLPIPACRTFFHAFQKLTSHGSKAVANSRRNKQQDDGTTNTTIFAQLDPGELAQTTCPLKTDADMFREAGGLIVAGSDTTAITLTYLTWCVLQRPQLHRALEAEVAALPAFTDAQLERQCPLLTASINEALRLYGAAPCSLPRRSVAPEGTTLAGFFVPPGATVSTQAWTLHRDAAFWHDPETFTPERWLDLAPTTAPASLHFQPFNSGLRICLGLRLAMMELRVAFAVFLREFRGRVALGESMRGEKGEECMRVKDCFLIRPKEERCMVAVDEEKQKRQME